MFEGRYTEYFLEDGLVLFGEESGSALALNERAGLVWCALSSTASEPDALRELCSLGYPEAEARRDLGSLLQALAAPGRLIHDPLIDSDPDRLVPCPSPSTDPGIGTVLRIDGYRIGLRASPEIITDRLAALVDALGDPYRESAVDAVIAIEPSSREHRLSLNGSVLQEGIATEQLAVALVYYLRRLVHSSISHRISIHGGAVSSGESATLLVAPSGWGKTSLISAMIREGYTFLTDDLILIDDAGRAMSLPLPLSVKEGSREFEEHDRAPVHVRLDGKRVRYLPASRPAVDGGGSRVTRIVFPRFVRESAVRVTPIGRAASLSLLFEAGAYLNGPDVKGGLERLLAWLSRIDLVQASYGSSDDCIRALEARDRGD